MGRPSRFLGDCRESVTNGADPVTILGMFSLQKLFGKGDKFQELLEAAAQEAHESVRQLLVILRTPGQAQSLDELALARRKEKRIAEEIGAELVKTFVTGLEREDIESLSHTLYKIPKSVEKFAERYNLVTSKLEGANFTRQAELLEKAAEVVMTMVQSLRKLEHIEQVKELNDRLQYLEGEADKLMIELLRRLYNESRDPVQVVVVKDLYELMERAIDRCRDVGNMVLQIVLKNS
jgi:uncharacterized protein Yka (UPF0111/DUF47 family)